MTRYSACFNPSKGEEKIAQAAFATLRPARNLELARLLDRDAGLKMLCLCKSLHKRRNWIHIGSEEAGPRVAAIAPIVETCRRLKIPIHDYLCSILPGLADFPIKRIGAWAARN